MKLDDGIDKEEAKELESAASSYGRYGALGIQMVVVIAVFVLGGHWLDGRMTLKTPWFTVAGVFLGVIGAIWMLFKETRRLR
jgi:heme/copper-type cytochrome/quinol oxidase subunit 4